MVLVKPLHLAIQDGDTIRAVIRATSTNQDGRTPGITQPSSKAQESMIRETYMRGGLNLSDTRFFEAHGTGTTIGDPIEAEAINAVFGERRMRDQPLFVGAVKSNIGHTEGASGLAGLIKTVMVLEKAIIPPNALFERVNPSIPLLDWNIEVSNCNSGPVYFVHKFLVSYSACFLAVSRPSKSICELIRVRRSECACCP